MALPGVSESLIGQPQNVTTGISSSQQNLGASISPAVITSSAATNDVNNIRNQHAEIVNGINAQADTIAQNKADAEAQAKAAADKAAAEKAAADKATADKQAQAIKMAALSSPNKVGTVPTPASPSETPYPNRSDWVNVTDSSGKTYIATKSIGTDGGVTYKPVSQTDIDLQTSKDQLAQLNKDFVEKGNSVSKLISDISNGVIPLNPAEQAQVNGLQQSFAQFINQQNLANQSAMGSALLRGYQKGSAEYDPNFHVGVIGSIVSAGINKVADLNIKMASAVASLTQSFKDNDIKAIKDSWEVYKQAAQERQSSLQKTIDTAQAQITKAGEQQNKVDDSIRTLIADAKKGGASNQQIDEMNKALLAHNYAAAVNAGGESLQASSNADLAKYFQYKKDALAKGLKPMDFTDYNDQQIRKEAQAKADAQASANSTASDKVQQKLEQQYRTVLSKEFSSRTGSLGIENNKVNQANHLDALFSQYYDPKTGTYNVPKSQYGELAIGLANLISPTGTVTEGARKEIEQRTAAGDIGGAITYITGKPVAGTTNDVIKNLVDSVDRQAQIAVSNRQSALDNMKFLAPTDLDPSRVEALNKATEMVKYNGQDRIDKAQIEDYIKLNPNATIAGKPIADVAASLAEVPGATPQDVKEYFIANGIPLK